MQVTKKVIENIPLCYCVSRIQYQGKEHYLVAAEKADRCVLFDEQGNSIDTIWKEPGGVMSMVHIPGTDGQFLTTQKFFSPNEADDSSIMVVTPVSKGNWQRHLLCMLPYVHRFDIMQSEGKKFLIACTVKTTCEYENDWRTPGKIYVAQLPDDLSVFNEAHPIELRVLKDDLFKNHGYYRYQNKDGSKSAIISTDNGIFMVYPPAKDQDWRIEMILDTQGSDAVLVDLDQDGQDELVVISPFHGDTLSIYKKRSSGFEKVYEAPEKMPFLHSIYGGPINGIPSVVVGYRQGKRDLIMLRYDASQKDYRIDYLDHDCGSANILRYTYNNQDVILSANRETNEVALYYIKD